MGGGVDRQYPDFACIHGAAERRTEGLYECCIVCLEKRGTPGVVVKDAPIGFLDHDHEELSALFEKCVPRGDQAGEHVPKPRRVCRKRVFDKLYEFDLKLVNDEEEYVLLAAAEIVVELPLEYSAR